MAEIAGLKLITPTSVAGTGVSLSGAKVVFTAATSISVNGVFDSIYDNYLVVLRCTSTVTGEWMRLRLRSSGSDASGSNYTVQRLYASGSAVGGTRYSSQNYSNLCSTDGSGLVAGIHTFLYGPALSTPTAIRSISAYSQNGAFIDDFATTHNLSTIYDGITISRESSNVFTGALTVYGLSQ